MEYGRTPRPPHPDMRYDNGIGNIPLPGFPDGACVFTFAANMQKKSLLSSPGSGVKGCRFVFAGKLRMRSLRVPVAKRTFYIEMKPKTRRLSLFGIDALWRMRRGAVFFCAGCFRLGYFQRFHIHQLNNVRISFYEGLAVSMDLFRRKQKLIFWIVTIIIVPSFVLVWGVRDYAGGSGQNMNFEIGVVDNKTVKYPEFEAFQKRIRAALGNIPLQFPNIPGVGTPYEDLYKYILTYTLLKDAEKAGVSVSDLQVGTYIENVHPIIATSINPDDPQSKERAVDNLCRQMRISRQEFLQGVREWQTISNYLDADTNVTAINSETVFAFYSLNKAECVVKRIHFLESDTIREQAKAEILAKPADELQEEVRSFIMGSSGDARYRNPALWRFDWVLIPFVPESSVRQPSDADISEEFEAGQFSAYQGKTLDEVRDQIKSKLIRDEVDRQTMRNFTVDVDPQLRGSAASEMELSELVKLTQLVKYGAVAGGTGSEPISAPAVAAALPEGTDFQIGMLLDGIDSEVEPARQAMIDEWSGNFSLVTRPFKSDKGYYRLRLLEYKSSTPAEIEAEDGKIKPEYYELALADMVGARMEDTLRNQATDTEQKIRAYLEAKDRGEPAPDAEMAAEYERMPTDVIPYLQITDANYELGRLPVGDLLGPIPYRDPETGKRGQELIVMVERRVPTRAAFEAEPEETRARFRQLANSNFQGSTGFTYTLYGPAAIIQPGAAIMGGLMDRLYKSTIRVNPELLRETQANEG